MRIMTWQRGYSLDHGEDEPAASGKGPSEASAGLMFQGRGQVLQSSGI